jgi:DNA-binding XRE family transcriptional regulator
MLDDAHLYELIGTRLRDVRERKRPRVTQEDLARMVKLERTSISNIESGKQRAPLHILYRICAILGADVTHIFPSFSDVSLADEVTEAKQSTVQLGNERIKLPEQVANIVRRLK